MAVESPDPQEQQLDTSTHSLKPSNPEVQTMSESGPVANNSENPVNGIHSVNGVGSASQNVAEGQQQQQMQPAPMANGVPHGYPYPPPPPGSGFAVGPPPEMFQQGDGAASGHRVMQTLPYPYPSQPGHQGPPGPPTGYVYQAMMPPPPPAGGVSPSSPTSAMSMPYGYSMWYPPHPGMPMQPPPGMMPPQNGMPPIPVQMGAYPPNGYPPNTQVNGDSKPSAEGNADPQQVQVNGQSGGISWVPGPGGLPPKEVAKNIPCRYFPDCRFGVSCWFLHPGSEAPNGRAPNVGDKQPDGQPPRAFFQGPLPPPVQYGPSGPWDPSTATPAPNSNQSDPGKSAYPSQNGTPAPSGYGLMYAPYPYGPNGYPPMYPVPPHLQQQQQPNSNPAASQSPSQSSQIPPQPSPHDPTQNLQQNPQSLHSTPHANSPSPNPSAHAPMYPMNGAGWYPPGAYPHPPPPQNMHHPGMNSQPMSPGQTMPGSLPLSPVSPHQGSNPLVMNMSPHSMSPMGAPNIPPQHMQHVGPPGPVPYPISPAYTNAPLQPRSPHQAMPPLSPPNHPGSPSTLYGGQPSAGPTIPVMAHGHHSRRESMSSMAAVPMGTVLGPHLDGNSNMEGPRSPSGFRDMGDNGGRRRGGHSHRGSWSSSGGFGPNSRKPPCAFYPAGKCKNGDLCRFPHIMPDENAPISPVSPRGGYSGSFGRSSRRPTILGPIEDKLAEMSVKEDGPGENGDAAPRSAGFSKGHNNSSPKMRGGRPPTSAPSTPIHRQNNHNQHNQPQVNQQPAQKLPSADDFPVLGGTATPPHAHGNGQPYGSAWGGPTAAQVLKGSMSGNKKATATVTSNGITGDASKELKSGSEEEQTTE